MIFWCQSAFWVHFRTSAARCAKSKEYQCFGNVFGGNFLHFGAKNALFALNQHLGAKRWSRAVNFRFLRPKRILVPSKALISIGFLCVRRMGASWGVKVRFVTGDYILERKSAIYAIFWCLGRRGALHGPQGYEFLRNYNGSEGMSPAHRNPLLSKKSDSQEVE